MCLNQVGLQVYSATALLFLYYIILYNHFQVKNKKMGYIFDRIRTCIGRGLRPHLPRRRDGSRFTAIPTDRCVYQFPPTKIRTHFYTPTRIRTGTPLRARAFKALVSAYSTMRASDSAIGLPGQHLYLAEVSAKTIAVTTQTKRATPLIE